MRFHPPGLLTLGLLLVGDLIAAFPASALLALESPSTPSTQTILVACPSPHCTPAVIAAPTPTSTFHTSTLSASPRLSLSTLMASLSKRIDAADDTLPAAPPSDLRDHIVSAPALHGQAKSVASFMLSLAHLLPRTDDTLPDPSPSDPSPSDPSLRAQAKSVASAVLGAAQRMPLSRASLLARVCGAQAVRDAQRQLDNTALVVLGLTCTILGEGGRG